MSADMGMGHATVTVVGIGYAGLPLAVAAATAGHRVWGLDIDRDRVALVNAGVPPVQTVTAGGLARAHAQLTATTDPRCLAGSAIAVICVPTPLGDDGKPDLGPLTGAARTVRDYLMPGQLVVIESTSYPGTTDELLRGILEQSGLRAGDDFALAYSPERADPGNRFFGLSNTPKIVGGFTSNCRDRAAAFYAPLTGGVHLTAGTREAEAAKLLENTYRQVNIALVNEFAQLCHNMGVDVWDMLAAAATKPFGYTPFRPGPGPGGHCIPADPMYLVQRAGEMGLRFALAETAHQINEGMPLWVADRICKHLDGVNIPLGQAQVLLLGVTYKPDVADTRGSPARPLARELRCRGATVAFHDPYIAAFDIGDSQLRRAADLELALTDADLTVVLQRHKAYDTQLLGHAHALFDTTGPVEHAHGMAL